MHGEKGSFSIKICFEYHTVFSFLGHRMASWGSMDDTKVGFRDMAASTIDNFPVNSIKD